MTAKGKRRVWWAILVLILIISGAVIALQTAINRNGAAVLNTVDRITGGTRGVELLHTASIGSNVNQKLLVYSAAESAAESSGLKPVIIFAHGGSWRSGNPDDYGFVARALAPEGYVVVLSGYRLGEAGKFPAMLEDTAKAVAWVEQNIAQFGGNSEAIFLSGHSAGAYNAAMVTLDRQWLVREGVDDTVIKGMIGLAGPYDFFPFDSDATKASFGDAPQPHATQPINFARGDAPPLLLITGEQDTTVQPRNSRVLAKAIGAAGGVAETGFFEGLDHVSILTAKASPWRRKSTVVTKITAFIDGITVTQQAQSSAASVSVQASSR